MYHFVAYILLFQEIIVYKIPPGERGIYNQPNVYVSSLNEAKDRIFPLSFAIEAKHRIFPLSFAIDLSKKKKARWKELTFHDTNCSPVLPIVFKNRHFQYKINSEKEILLEANKWYECTRLGFIESVHEQ